MKKYFCFVVALLILCVTICGCSDDYEYSYDSSKTNSKYKDHNGDGEYGFSDYLKDQDPDLYDAIKDRYESLD